MFENIKNAASSVWSAVQYVTTPILDYVIKPALAYIAAPIFITARTLSSIGQTIFTIRKFTKYLTGSEDHLATLPSIGVAVLFNLLTFIPTRVPLLWRFFRSEKAVTAPPLQLDNEEREEIIPEEAPPPLGKVGKMIYAPSLFLAWCSTGFVSANGYLFGIASLNFALKTLGDYLLESLETDSVDEPNWDERINYAVQAGAFLIFLANLASFISYNQRKNQEAARKFAKHVEDRDIPWDRYTASALALAGPAIASSFFVGVYSTQNSLNKLPGLTLLSDGAKQGIAIFSGVTALSYNAMTGLPAVRSLFKKEKDICAIQACWEKPLRISVNITGFADTITTTLGTYTSFANTLSEVSGLDPYHLGIITLGIAISSSAFINTYQFSVRGAIDCVLELHHRDRGDFFQAVPQAQEDIETESPDSPALDRRSAARTIMIGRSPHTLFNTSAASVPTRSNVEEDPRATLAFSTSY